MFLVFSLVFVVALIVLFTTKFNIHPFLSLLGASLVMGFVGGLESGNIVAEISTGFGNTLKSIGIIIAFGTIIGAYLEKSGGAKALADAVLKVVGEKKSAFAMNITGFIVSIPVFCDSGFVILSTLNKALSRRTGIPLAVLAIALGTGLYATHVFVPPTPGPLAAAATIGADLGLVLIFGLLVAIPSALAGLYWARFYGPKIKNIDMGKFVEDTIPSKLPSRGLAFAPILVPIILIALKSVADYPSHPFGEGLFTTLITFIGHPVIALFIGVGFAFLLKSNHKKESHFDWVTIGLRNAGVIILITGAGGSFGNVLRATDLGDIIGSTFSGWEVGLFLPFIIAAVLKSAQGSSTVSIITTAAIVSPLLISLGLDGSTAKALVVLAIGAGAMTVSHLNDSYFWVVAQFSGMDTSSALRGHTIATLFQGLVAMATIYIISLFII